MQKQVLIEARFEPSLDLEMTPVQVRVEATHGTEHIVIAEGDIRSAESGDRLRTLWNVTNVRPGRYLITVTATAGDRSGTATVNVDLHPAPSVSLEVTSVRNQRTGALVTYRAIASSAVGTTIKEFTWTPGDASAPRRTRTGSYSHVYVPRDEPYIVWLEVNDALGGSTLVARDLDLRNRDEYLQETNECGCEDMTVLVPAINPPPRSSAYCAVAVPASPGCVQIANPAPPDNCPAGQIAFKCPLGRIAPALPGQRDLGWRFEVVAKLHAHTNNANACTQGQYARVTRTRDGGAVANPQADAAPPAGQITLPDGAGGVAGFTFTAVGPPNPYPGFAGPNYGGDDYAAPWDFKRHKPLGFRWLDGPRGPVGVNARTQDDEFITFVRGDLGTCWCRFSIRQSWTAANGMQGPGLALIDSHNCRIFNPTQ